MPTRPSRARIAAVSTLVGTLLLTGHLVDDDEPEACSAVPTARLDGCR